MVAMLGRIMPAPLLMPVKVTVLPPIRTLLEWTLGSVSVVMMPWAALNQWSGPRLAMAAGRPATRRSRQLQDDAGGEGQDFGGGHASAQRGAGVLGLCRPSSPVPALALPVLMTSALIGPPAAGWAWQTCTGAAQKRLRVNTPATLVPGAKRNTVRSRRLALRMPASVTPISTPATGKFRTRRDLQVNGHDFVSINEQDGTAARWAAGYYPTALLQGRDCRVADRREGANAPAASGQGWLAGAREDGALGPDPDRGHIQHAGIAVGQDRAHRAVRRLQHRAAGRHVRAAGASGHARPREAENSRSPGWAPAARGRRTAPGCRRDGSCRPARSRATAAPETAAGGGHPAAVPASAATAAPPPWARCLPCATASARARPPVLSAGRAAGSTWIHVPGGTGCRSSWLPMARWQLAKRGWPPSMTNSTRWPWAHSQPSWAWSRAISTDRVSGCRAVAA